MVDDCDCNEMTHEEMVHQMDDQTLPFTQTKFDGYVIQHTYSNGILMKKTEPLKYLKILIGTFNMTMSFLFPY